MQTHAAPRKGGDIALETAVELNRLGLPTRLHLVGCGPPGAIPGFVVRHGFISKNTPEGRSRLDALLSESHFLIVPSRAECYPLVFADVSSYGLPSLAAEGGIQQLMKLMVSPAKYRELALGAFAEYESCLNWRVARAAAVALLKQL